MELIWWLGLSNKDVIEEAKEIAQEVPKPDTPDPFAWILEGTYKKQSSKSKARVLRFKCKRDRE